MLWLGRPRLSINRQIVFQHVQDAMGSQDRTDIVFDPTYLINGAQYRGRWTRGGEARLHSICTKECNLSTTEGHKILVEEILYPWRSLLYCVGSPKWIFPRWSLVLSYWLEFDFIIYSGWRLAPLYAFSVVQGGVCWVSWWRTSRAVPGTGGILWRMRPWRERCCCLCTEVGSTVCMQSHSKDIRRSLIFFILSV